NNKNRLALVIDPTHHKADLELEPDTDKDSGITYDPTAVVCNLGRSPTIGKAFGVDVEPYITTIESKNFGRIHLYRKLDDKEMSSLKKAMNALYPKLKQNRAHQTLPLAFKIKHAKGKYAGYYKFKRKGKSITDYICL